MRKIVTAALLLLSTSAAALASQALPGVFALSSAQPKVTATLSASPGTGAGRQILDVEMTRLGGAAPITAYDVELSKRIHLIAVSADLCCFVHEHGETPDEKGHFRVRMAFPRAGLWHIYADAVPSGLPQQVMRFDLDLGGKPQPAVATQVATLHARDGRYGARFAAMKLKAGQEATLSLTLLRDNKPAPDVTPYLGVPAHAVFIEVADLTYLHAHAVPAGDMEEAMPGHDMAAMPSMPGGRSVGPRLTLHVRPPHAGSYRLWIQFRAGGVVRTLPFVVDVG